MVKSSKSKSARKQSKKAASTCVSKCDMKMWDRMNRNAVAWSIGLLIGAVIIVDIPVFRETFKSDCGSLGLNANSVSSQCSNCDCSSDNDNRATTSNHCYCRYYCYNYRKSIEC